MYVDRSLNGHVVCSVFDRAAMIHGYSLPTCVRASMYARKSTHITTVPRDHSIPYDRSRLSLLAAVSNTYCERGIDEWTAGAVWFSTSN